MRYVKSLIIIFSLFTLTAYAQEETRENFPKTGYAKNDGIYVKAGDNINFENLCALSKSESVKIIDRRYSWFKILLPRKAFLYINKDYVDLTSDEKGIGIVSAASVNLRAGPGTRFSIIGQISKPEKVSILSEDAGWYKIESPYGTTGWVLSSQIDIAEEKTKEESEAKSPVIAEAKSKTASSPASSAIRLNTNCPVPGPAPKGNLSISTSTKNNR